MYSEQKMDEVIRQRDRAEEVIDKIKSMLGIEKEWSNNYGYEAFLEEARSIIISQQVVDDVYHICTYCGYPKKRTGMPCDLCQNV